jgi:1,4-dihydroxy-2-naphthoate octaprenyltransferase
VRGRPSLLVHGVAAAVGGVLLGIGIAFLRDAVSLGAAFLTLIGFIILWWTIADYRRFRPGTDESELDGGHTLE